MLKVCESEHLRVKYKIYIYILSLTLPKMLKMLKHFHTPLFALFCFRTRKGFNEMTRDQHLDLLKQAIAAKPYREPRSSPPPHQEIPRYSTSPTLLATSLAQLYLEDVIDDPVGNALQEQMRELGKCLLHRLLGNTAAMLKVAEEVAELDQPNWGYRINVIDKSWDGIGGWAA
jgi:hypothetical protein